MERQRQEDYYDKRFHKLVRQVLIRDGEERTRRIFVDRGLRKLPFAQRPSEIEDERRKILDYDRRRQETVELLEASVLWSRNLSVPAGP